MEFLARGMSPDDEYLNCLAGEGSAWDLIASYAYCAFYVWVIIVYRDDLTPVYRLWYGVRARSARILIISLK